MGVSRYSIGDGLPTYSEEDCESALFMAKWPEGYRCPRCSLPHYYRVASRGRGLLECVSCRHQTSLTARTILEGTRTPLYKWFQAMYLMQIGISAKLLAELILVTYKTAWLMNHKLRHAIEHRDAKLPLAGNLQLLGEFYGYEFHRHFSGSHAAPEHKAQSVIVGASVHKQTDMVEQLKIKRVDRTRNVLDGMGVIERFLLHHAVDSEEEPGEIKIFDRHNRKERSALHAAWTEAVRWLARTFGGIGPKHLQAYLDEFCFRRMFRSGSLVELVGLCGTTATIIYRKLVGRSLGVYPIKCTSLA